MATLEKTVRSAAITVTVLFIGLSLFAIVGVWFVDRKATEISRKGFGLVGTAVGVVDAGGGTGGRPHRDEPDRSATGSTASLWLKGEMEGKPAGVFTSTGSTHGGQETTLLTMMVPLIHLGMVIVGVPYTTEGMLHTEARGGTPYGATTIAGPRGELQPTKEDIAIASVLGQRVATIAKKLRG